MWYGFVRNASPPSMILFNSSISVPQLVTKMIGASEKLRIPEDIAKPLSCGSLISNRFQTGLDPPHLRHDIRKIFDRRCLITISLQKCLQFLADHRVVLNN